MNSDKRPGWTPGIVEKNPMRKNNMIDPKDPNDNPVIETICGKTTLLDYFAAKAMGIAVGMARDNYGNWKTNSMARNAYDVAESMLAERKRRMGGGE